jgi:GTPase
LLHLVDLSHPSYEEHIAVVNTILDELQIKETPVLIVFNKVDKIKESKMFLNLQQKYNDAVFISAKKNIRLGRLIKKILSLLQEGYIVKNYKLTYEKSYLVSKIRDLGEILNQNYSEKNVSLKIRLKKENEYKLENILNV